MNEQELINTQRKWYLFFSVSELGLFDIEMELKQFDELFRSRFFDIEVFIMAKTAKDAERIKLTQ